MRFEKLYRDVEINLEGCQIDPEKILDRKGPSDVIQLPQEEKKKKRILEWQQGKETQTSLSIF